MKLEEEHSNMELTKKNIEEALKGIKTLFNFYIAVYAVFFIRGIIRDVGRFLGVAPAEESGVFKILDFVVPKNHFSLIFGILFGVFIALLCLKIKLLRDLILNFRKEIGGAFCQYINYFPWLTSPFSQFKWRGRAFWIFLFIGSANLLSISLSHIIKCPDLSSILRNNHLKNIIVFKTIGAFDLGILLAVFYTLSKIKIDIALIREVIQNHIKRA